jgi:Fe-S-cluster containining protein
VTDLSRLYKIVELLSSQPECNQCNLCEQNVGLVYLIGTELNQIRDTTAAVITTADDIMYLPRKQMEMDAAWCNCFDVQTNRCRIYSSRPLCCRLYPLDLMKLDSRLWWVIHGECPIAQRFENERKLDLLSAITIRLETELTPSELRLWMKNDDSSQTIEAFSREGQPIHKLRPFGSETRFP